MEHASFDILLKRYGHFTGQTRREAILKFDQGYTNGAQAQSGIFKLLKKKRETGLESATFSWGSWNPIRRR